MELIKELISPCIQYVVLSNARSHAGEMKYKQSSSLKLLWPLVRTAIENIMITFLKITG